MLRGTIFVESSMTLSFTQKEVRYLPKGWFIWRPAQRQQWKFWRAHNLLVNIITAVFECPSKILELYQQEVLVAQARQTIAPYLDEAIDEFMIKYYPLWWENIPLLLKHRIYRQAQKQLPLFLDNYFDAFIDRANELLDFSDLVTERLQQQPLLVNSVNRIMRSIYCRNLLGLKPTSSALNQLITEEFLSPNRLIQGIFTGATPSKAKQIIHQQLKLWVEGPLLKPTLQWMLGFQGYLFFKNRLTDQVIQLLQQSLIPADIQRERTNRLQEYGMDQLKKFSFKEKTWMK